MKKLDLLNGNITSALARLAIPIMGSSFIQMAYSLIDTAWVGLLGSPSVTAVATAGIFLWIGQGISMIPQIGGQILVGQSIGEKEMKRAQDFAKAAIQLIIFIITLYAIIVIATNRFMIGFFNLHSKETISMARSYLIITGIGLLPLGLDFVITGLYTATGDSTTPFKFNVIGMVINIILDPALIFGWAFFPRLGVNGAAIATVFSQLIVTLLYIAKIKKDEYLFNDFSILGDIQLSKIKHIARLGFPPAIQNIGFAFITMVLSRMITVYGDAAIAVQRIGSQIESVTWMTADGFSFATNTFMAQNYGAGKKDRIREGYHKAFIIVTVTGLITSLALYFCARPIFSVFIHEADTIASGVNYLHIVAFSQLFMFYEITTAGAFGGLGKTKLPSIIGLILTASRIPLAILLCSILNSIDGVWWAISGTSIVKGIIVAFLFIRTLQREFTERKGV